MRTLLGLMLASALVLAAPPKVLLRCDDLGFCHSVDVAAQGLMDRGLVFSASVLVPLVPGSWPGSRPWTRRR